VVLAQLGVVPPALGGDVDLDARVRREGALRVARDVRVFDVGLVLDAVQVLAQPLQELLEELRRVLLAEAREGVVPVAQRPLEGVRRHRFLGLVELAEEFAERGRERAPRAELRPRVDVVAELAGREVGPQRRHVR